MLAYCGSQVWLASEITWCVHVGLVSRRRRERHRAKLYTYNIPQTILQPPAVNDSFSSGCCFGLDRMCNCICSQTTETNTKNPNYCWKHSATTLSMRGTVVNLRSATVFPGLIKILIRFHTVRWTKQSRPSGWYRKQATCVARKTHSNQIRRGCLSISLGVS